jgi:REP element-mobilizing transposase RayT
MNRARSGADLFVDKADYQQFIDLLKETADLFNINVAAFCLMPTHYHLMVQSPDANLSRCMRQLRLCFKSQEMELAIQGFCTADAHSANKQSNASL